MAQSHFTVVRQFLSFCALGAVGTLAQYLVLVVGVELGRGPVVSSTLGFIVGALVNYTLSYYYVFRSNSSHSHTITKFFTVAIFGLGLNAFVLSSAIYGLRLHYLAGQVLATGIVVIWNFVGNRWWTFREAEYGKSR
jgi:putative flippase GtrA